MINADEDSLICDLAQTYHVFNYKELPLRLVATLAVGLGEESRIMRKLTNQKYSSKEIVLYSILDKLNILIWQKTEDATKGRNMPKSIVEIMLNGDSDTQGYMTSADFEKERQKIINELKGGKNG